MNSNKFITQLSRRDVLRAIALGSGAALVAACQPLSPAAPTAKTSAPADAAKPAEVATAVPATAAPAAAVADEGTPKSGGVYRALFGDEVPNLDAAIAFGWADFWASYFLIYNRLYTFDAKNNFLDELADGMPKVSADGLKYTVALKKGVKFHDGSELKASDVKFTYDRTMDPDLKSPAAGFNGNIAGAKDVVNGKTKDVTGVKVIDDYTIEFTLSTPQATFPAILATTINGIVPEKAVKAAGKDWGVKIVIGTGPFKLTEWSPGEKITFERNADYFKKGLPYLDKVELYPQVKNELRVLKWENGEAEFADAPPGAELNRINADPNLKSLLRSEPSPIFNFLALANNAPEFADVRVRQAMALALDKKTLAESFGFGAATVQEGIFTNGIPGFDPQYKSKYQYNIDAAKKLMQDAGAKDIKIKMHVGADNSDRGQIVQADMKKIGIEVELITGDFSAYKDQIEKGEIQMRWAGFGPDYPDPSVFITTQFTCDEKTKKPTTICDAELLKILGDSASLPISDVKRLDMFTRAQEIAVNEKVYLIPLVNINFISLKGKTVRNDPVYYYLPALEQAWLAQ